MRADDQQEDRKISRRTLRILLWITYVFLCLFFIGAGTVIGLYFGYSSDLPSIQSLEGYRPDVITEVYSDNNQVIGRFAIEKRILISYDQIPKYLKNAIVATEDKNFFSHSGIDPLEIFRAAVKDVKARRIVQGGSTLTQQLTKLLFLKPEKNLDRKIKEAILAVKLERRYTKEQIFTFYCNQIYMGHGTYGVAAAADFYFGKPLDKLTVEECALLAALLKAPVSYSPLLHPENALARRNYVLKRMAEEGYISRKEVDELRNNPIVLKKTPKETMFAAYFVEWVRRYLEEKYETDEIWRKGLRVYTTLNIDMQKAADNALANGLRSYDKRHGWRGVKENILKDKSSDLQTYKHADWKTEYKVEDMVTGLVTHVDKKEARVKLGTFNAPLGPKEIEWTGRKTPDKLLRTGDLVLVKVKTVDGGNTLKVTLEQTPQVQGALLALENATGAIKAMVGGYDFNISKFNRATQALRQTGSAFKPFVYTAALEAGYSPDDMILDAPISFTDDLGHVWSPHNYDYEYKGEITLRKALAESRNIPAVRLASQVGIQTIIRMVRRFGIMSPMQPYLPLALGACESTLLDMTSAFSTFPNRGTQAKPYFIRRVEDYNGVVKEENKPRFAKVIPPDVASKMVEFLRGVVEFGTSTSAKSLNRPVAGKTGTTNEFTDAWFIGFTPSLTCSVWVGFDEKKTLGNKEAGSRAALPVWIDFMKGALANKPVENFQLVEDSKLAEERPTDQKSTEKLISQTPTTNLSNQKPTDKTKKIIVEDIR